MEVEDDIDCIKDIKDGTKNDSCNPQLFVQSKALFIVIGHRNVEEQRIQENCNHTKYETNQTARRPSWINQFLDVKQVFDYSAKPTSW